MTRAQVVEAVAVAAAAAVVAVAVVAAAAAAAAAVRDLVSCNPWCIDDPMIRYIPMSPFMCIDFECKHNDDH